MRQNFLLLFSIFIATSLCAQTFKVHGKITNSKLEPLAFVTIQIKELQTGTTSKEDGTYELKLEEGKYDLVISIIGYQPQTISIVINRDYVQNIILEEDVSKKLSEVVVKSKDKAEEIIRNVIRNKENIVAAAGAYSCHVYIKAVQQDSLSVNKKNKIKKINSYKANNHDSDLQRMVMAEISLQLDYESAQRMKEERLGVKKLGKPEGLFYLSATEGDFSLYNNLIKVPAVSTTPFLSPISYSGLMAYKFKTLKVEQKGTRKIYTISVKPRQLSNATIEGEVTISDSAWVILSSSFHFPSYHLAVYDFFEVTQQYQFVQYKAWLLSRQEFNYFSKGGQQKQSGQTIVYFTDYELNKVFPKKYFGTEISATAQEAYEKDSTFWEKSRTEPLTQKEIRFIHYKDSVYRATHTKQYLDSIDYLTNKVTWKKITIYGQAIYNRQKERTWNLPSILSLYQPIGFGGTRISPSFFYAQTFPSRKNISVFANVSYGIRNQDINGSVRISRMYNPFNRGFYSISAGKDFQAIYQGDAWINMLKRSNYYLNNYLSVGHGLELVNGLMLLTDVDIAFRRSLNNYKTGSFADSLWGNILTDNHAVAFEPYNAVYGKITLKYTPYQRYIREPKEKIILGSKWPTFFVTRRKGVSGIMNSKVDFDYLEFGAEQQINMGLLGITRYTIKTGDFLTQKDLRLVDYQFQRRGDPYLFLNPNEAFQALDSTFPLFHRSYQGHLVHEFNGAFINKIPLLKKLGLREVGGAGFLIAPERNLRYAETFAGVERVFKWPFNPLSKFKLGVYVVGSVANQFRNPIQYKIGITTWDKVKNKWR